MFCQRASVDSAPAALPAHHKLEKLMTTAFPLDSSVYMLYELPSQVYCVQFGTCAEADSKRPVNKLINATFIINILIDHSYYVLFRMEDAIDAFSMIFAGGQSWLPSWLIVYTLSVGLCFYSGMYTTFQPNKYIPQYHSGITVTKQMSGTARAVIAQVRRGKSMDFVFFPRILFFLI